MKRCKPMIHQTPLTEDTYKTAELIRTCCPAVEIREVQLKAQMWLSFIGEILGPKIQIINII